MRLLPLTLLLTVLAACAATLQPTASAEPAASRIVDRTLSCSVALSGGLREARVGAGSGVRLLGDRSKWRSLADAGSGDSAGFFASVAAGNPLAPDSSGFVFPPWRVSIRADKACRSVPRIPFSRAGLTGGTASQFHDDYDCASGGRVVVRVRAIFRSPTTLRRTTQPNGQRYLRAAGTVREAVLAVRGASGKPLAYARALESGAATLYTSKACVAD
jgi:hypothetical protein